MSEENKPKIEDEASPWEAIRTFENILELFPNDTNAMASLALAYEEVGDAVGSHSILLKLGKIYLENNEPQNTINLCKARINCVGDDPEFSALLVEAKKVADKTKPKRKISPKKVLDKSLKTDPHAEIDLAWKLLENELITQDEYEQVINSLGNSHSSSMGQGGVSALQELESMETININKIIAFLEKHANIPYVELSRWEIADELIELFPTQTAQSLGIMPFAKQERDLMVAILSPLNMELRESLCLNLNCNIHFYLTSPFEFRKTLEGIAAKQSA